MSLESTIRMMTESKVVKEDGHTDVASAKRQCKTAMEDAQAIIGVLDGMNDEDALPTWWTNKLAIAANSMNKLNDYLANPTEQKEEVELDEATIAKELNIDPKDVAKLKALMVMYTQAMKIPSGSPKHNSLSREISKLRKDLRMEKVEKEEVEMEDLDNLIEEALNEEDDFKPHMMYDPKTGKAYKAEKPEDHERMAKMGYTHEKPELDEAKEPFAVVDTADGNKVVGTASDEKGAKSIITTSQLPPMKIKDKKTLKIVKVKKKQMIGQPIKEEKVSMTPFGVSKSLVDAVSAVLSGKKPVAERKDIPEEILDDDVADFIGAASKAAQAGKKTFKFGDKEYPVTIKKDTAKKVASKMDEEKPAKKEEKEDKDKGKKEPVQIDPEIKEETK